MSKSPVRQVDHLKVYTVRELRDLMRDPSGVPVSRQPHDNFNNSLRNSVSLNEAAAAGTSAPYSVVPTPQPVALGRHYAPHQASHRPQGPRSKLGLKQASGSAA